MLFRPASEHALRPELGSCCGDDGHGAEQTAVSLLVGSR